MKTKSILPLTGLALAILCVSSGLAQPPVQRSIAGIIQSIDFTNRALTLESPDKSAPRVFIWDETTSIKLKGDLLDAQPFQVGRRARLWYRCEPGRLVIRDIELSKPKAVCCCNYERRSTGFLGLGIAENQH